MDAEAIAMERWQMRDPFEVVARLEAQEQAKAARTPEAKQERAKKKLEELFKEGSGNDKPD